MKKHYLLTGLIAATVALTNTNALADSASQIEATTPLEAPNTAQPGLTYDGGSGNYPTITAVLSSPVGVVDGYTYTHSAFLAQDQTGSIDIFATTAQLLTYTPTVGDSISTTGTYSPFDQIPELESLVPGSTVGGQTPGTSIPTIGPANQMATLTTIPAININGAQLPLNVAGYYLELDNVTITGAPAVFPTHANGTYGVTDGANSMVMFYWASSYSVDGAMAGSAIPTGPVDIDGFVDSFGTGTAAEAEFVPMLITPVPEPSVLSLFGVGGAGSVLALISRFRKKA
jgi:hypothetical protein